MKKQVSFEEAYDSQKAIREYMYFSEKNEYQHTARVVVEQEGETLYNEDTTVCAHIETNDSIVDISWKEDYDSHFFVSYNNHYQKFKCYGGTLVIDCQDRNERIIQITIS